MRRNTDRVAGRRLLLAAAYGLTSSLLGTTVYAGKCESGKAFDQTSYFKWRSAKTPRWPPARASTGVLVGYLRPDLVTEIADKLAEYPQRMFRNQPIETEVKSCLPR